MYLTFAWQYGMGSRNPERDEVGLEDGWMEVLVHGKMQSSVRLKQSISINYQLKWSNLRSYSSLVEEIKSVAHWTIY